MGFLYFCSIGEPHRPRDQCRKGKEKNIPSPNVFIMPCPPFPLSDLPLFVFFPSVNGAEAGGRGGMCCRDPAAGSWIQMFREGAGTEKGWSREMRNTKPDSNTKGMGIQLFRSDFCPQQRTGEQKGHCPNLQCYRRHPQRSFYLCKEQC